MNRRRALLIMGATAVCAGFVATLSQATGPGTNGRIAFMRYRLHDAPYQAEIFTVNSDGSGERMVTHVASGIRDDEPDWSPDGSHIAFQRCSRLPCHIWSVRPDGRGLRRLSPSCPPGSAPPKCPDDSSPVYSPDGRHIAFVRFRSPKSNGVWVADANLRHAHRVGPGWEPGWSPDGKQLAFVWKPGNQSAVYVSNADGSGLHRITSFRLRAGDHPDWSPDGTRILFNAGGNHFHHFRGQNLFTVRPDGTGLRQLTHFHGLTNLENGSFSPDGESIVFATVVGAANPHGATLDDVFVMSADGTDVRPVTRARNWDGSPDWGPRP